MSWSRLLLTVLMLLISEHSVGCARGRHRAARLSSIWDIILPPKQSTAPVTSDILTNKIKTVESQHKITIVKDGKILNKISVTTSHSLRSEAEVKAPAATENHINTKVYCCKFFR